MPSRVIMATASRWECLVPLIDRGDTSQQITAAFYPREQCEARYARVRTPAIKTFEGRAKRMNINERIEKVFAFVRPGAH